MCAGGKLYHFVLGSCKKQNKQSSPYLWPLHCSDGDIVHEILNQEPCVIGLGGIYAIVALVLYFIMVIMCCKLPQDDPYGLCCKNRNRRESAPTSSGSGKFGLLGSSKNEETFKGSSAQDPRRERPGWLSEDASKTAEEGDEII